MNRHPAPEKLREHERWMALALEEARRAGERGEVPVGAAVVREGRLIALAGNTREGTGSPLGHAETEALAAAARVLGDWRLAGCTLYVTLEPCAMCAGACLAARLEEVVYAAPDPAAGCLGSRLNLFAAGLGPVAPPRVLAGVLEEEAAALLSGYFARLRGL